MKMKNEALIESLQNALESFKDVYVTFSTKRGTNRTMHCSRKSGDVPQEGKDDFKLNGPAIVAVYDYQNSAWRSFRKDSVISFEVKT
jgi:hypothetical protein